MVTITVASSLSSISKQQEEMRSLKAFLSVTGKILLLINIFLLVNFHSKHVIFLPPEENATTILELEESISAVPRSHRPHQVVVSHDDNDKISHDEGRGTIHNPATKCYSELELIQRQAILLQHAKQVPVMYSVKVMEGGVFNVLFSLVSHWKEWVDESNFTCNGIKGGRIVGGDQDTTNNVVYEHTSAFILECPPMNGNEDLQNVVIWNAMLANKKNNGTEAAYYSYDSRKLSECERLDIKYYSPPIFEKKEEDSKKLTIGAVVTFGDGEIGWERTLEWAEYLMIIGVDHIWAYCFQPWNLENEDRGSYERPFITWIPFDYVHILSQHNENDLMVNAHRDALFRAKRIGIDWLSNVDNDEYIVIRHLHQEEKKSQDHLLASAEGTDENQLQTVGILKEYVNAFSEKKSKIRSLEINSIPFGSNQDDEGGTLSTNEHLIDNQWRQRGDVNKLPWTRYKAIYNVENAFLIHKHFTTAHRTGTENIKVPMDEMFIHHFKQPQNPGVWCCKWKGGKQIHPSKDIEKDSFAAQTYHNLMDERMNKKVHTN